MTNEDKAKELARKISSEVPAKVAVYAAAMDMAEWKDKKIKELLLAYTKWLDKRGFFKEELQCDYLHQIETFLEMKGEGKC